MCHDAGAQAVGSSRLVLGPDRPCYTRRSFNTSAHGSQFVWVMKRGNGCICTVSANLTYHQSFFVCLPLYMRTVSSTHNSQAVVSLLAVYDNRIEKNEPYGLCGPATCSDACVSDFITVNYFDQAPFTTGLRDPCCQASQFACIPMTCCGPPVIFSHETICCCCISEANCKVCCLVEGVTIKTSPCNCWGCKSCCGIPNPCCGKPCYLEQSAALTYPLTCATFSP